MENNTKNDSGAQKVPEVKKDVKPSTTEGASQKNWAIISTTVLAIVIIAIFAIAHGRKSAPVMALGEGCRPGDAFSQTTGKPCLSGKEVDEEAQAMVTPCKEGEVYNQNTGELCADDKSMALKSDSSGYEATLKQFEGKSIMFDALCVGTPATLSVSAGTRVLVANHSSATNSLAFGGRKETLEPYHYMTNVFKVAGEYPVACNDKDTATVSVK